MDKFQVRIECLRLAHRHDREPAQVVEAAKTLEAYVLWNEQRNIPEPLKKDSGKKNVGNLFK